MYKKISVLLAILCTALIHAGKLELASPFTEHMVLQRNMEVPVWGWGTPNGNVKVSINGKTASTKVRKDGRWATKLPVLKAGGPYKFSVSSGEESINFSDVLVGEVWLCSGQSNMQMGLTRCGNGKKLLPEMKKRPIRSLSVKRIVSLEKQERFEGKWQTTPCPSAVGAFFAYNLQVGIDVPVGIIESCWGSASIEAYMPEEFAQILPHFKSELELMRKYDAKHVTAQLEKEATGERRSRKMDIFFRTRVNGIYNAMLHPLAPYAMRGMVWYQGEANAGGALGSMRQYGESIVHWCKYLRQLWNKEDFQFYAVMLPRFKYICPGSPSQDPTTPDAYSWAWMRESQQKVLTLANTAMVNTIDCGDLKDIHPKDKEPIGKRLALLAQANIHGMDVQANGPTFKKLEKVGAKSLRVYFEHADGLTTTDNQPPTGFWVAGKDMVWKPAMAKIEKSTVVLTCDEVKRPTFVRYAFAGFPKVNLVNKAKLPAFPFRTDSYCPEEYKKPHTPRETVKYRMK